MPTRASFERRACRHYPFVGAQLVSLRDARSSRFGLIWELQDEEPVSAGCDVDAILWPSASAAKLGSQLNHLLKTAEIHPKECGLLDLSQGPLRCAAAAPRGRDKMKRRDLLHKGVSQGCVMGPVSVPGLVWWRGRLQQWPRWLRAPPTIASVHAGSTGPLGMYLVIPVRALCLG